MSLLEPQVRKLPPPPQSVLQQYLNLGTAVPESLRAACVTAKSKEEVEALAKAFTGDRAGYVNTGDFPTAEGGFI